MTRGIKKLRETTRDRHLKWINYYSSNNFGIWIECTKCKKWRKNYNYDESHEVEESWCCSMNTLDNGTKGSCDDPEENTDEDYLEYSPGSIVWAKLDGYPWWPAMVDEDPDVEEYFWRERKSVFYNVTFLDENVTRSWVSAKNLCPFWRPPRNKYKLKDQKGKYSSAIMKAEEKAKTAVKMTFKERLQKYSFAHLYKGKWPLAKDYESEDDVRDMTDILLDEVNDLDSLLSFSSDAPDNPTMLENERDRHENSPTTFSGIIKSKKSKANMDTSNCVADSNNGEASTTHKNQNSMKASPLNMKVSKSIKNKCSNNVSKSKKNHPTFEKNTNFIKRIEKANILGRKDESLINESKSKTEKNKKDNELKDFKNSSECCKVFGISAKTSEMQNENSMEIVERELDDNLIIIDENSNCETLTKDNSLIVFETPQLQHGGNLNKASEVQNENSVEIVEQELDKNLITRDETSKCETLTKNNSLTDSETSQAKHIDNLSKSIEWVVNEYKYTEDIETEKNSIDHCKSVAPKEVNECDRFKFSKKVSKIDKNNVHNNTTNNNEKKGFSCPSDKNLTNSGVNNKKRKNKLEETPTNTTNKKIKPSFKPVKPSFKTIKNQSSLENGKEKDSKTCTAISKSPDKKFNSSDCITTSGNTSVPNNIEINHTVDEMEFKCKTNNNDLPMNHSTMLENHCSTSSEVPNPKTDFAKEDILIPNGLTDKKINQPNLDIKCKTLKKDSETSINGAIKNKKFKAHLKSESEIKIEDSNDMGSKCTKSHDSFNVIKSCENFVKENEIDTVPDESSRHSLDAGSPSQIKISDDGFFDISLSDEELEI